MREVEYLDIFTTFFEFDFRNFNLFIFFQKLSNVFSNIIDFDSNVTS